MKNKLMKWFKTSPAVGEGGDIYLPTDTREPMRLGLIIIGVGLSGFLLWASLAPLGEGATANGTVVVDSRRKTVQHSSGGIVEQISVKEGELVKEGQLLIKLVATNTKTQLSIHENQSAQLQKQLMALKPMVDEGYHPRLQYDELKRQKEESDLRAKAVREELERTEVRSPITGHVMGMKITTIGAVIPSAGTLMDIVPEGDGLVIEAKIIPALIDRMKPGMDVHVRFSALNQRITPVIEGKVERVSADKFNDPSPNPILANGYYTAKIKLSSDQMSKLGDQNIQPGMPADVIFNTGTRTFMNYLLKPFADRVALSLKER